MLLFTISLAFLTGCGNDSPELTAQKWQKAIVSGDLKGANEISTEKTHELNDIYITKMSDKKDEITKAFAEAKFDIVKYESNFAVVSSSNVEGEEIELVKLNGKWLVSLSEMMKKRQKEFEYESIREGEKRFKKVFEQIHKKRGSNGESDK